jgi:hypothetical protein
MEKLGKAIGGYFKSAIGETGNFYAANSELTLPSKK